MPLLDHGRQALLELGKLGRIRQQLLINIYKHLKSFRFDYGILPFILQTIQCARDLQ